MGGIEDSGLLTVYLSRLGGIIRGCLASYVFFQGQSFAGSEVDLYLGQEGVMVGGEPPVPNPSLAPAQPDHQPNEPGG